MSYLFKKQVKKSSKGSSWKQKTKHKLQQFLLASSPKKFRWLCWNTGVGTSETRKMANRQEWTEEACCVEWVQTRKDWSAGLECAAGPVLWAMQHGLAPLTQALIQELVGAWVTEAGQGHRGYPGGMGSSMTPSISYHWLILPKSRIYSSRIITWSRLQKMDTESTVANRKFQNQRQAYHQELSNIWRKMKL